MTSQFVQQECSAFALEDGGGDGQIMRYLTRILWMLLTLGLSVFPLTSAIEAQSSAFIGNWQPPTWDDQGSNLGLAFRITQTDPEFIGSVRFRDSRGEHEAHMLNHKLKGGTLLFEVDDDYFGQKLTFSMTIQKGGNTALVQSWGGDMFSDFLLVKQP